MATLSDDDIRHIAKLARLELEEEKVPKFAKELTAILDYIDQLSEVDTKEVEPMKQVTGMTNSFRDDEIVECNKADELLGTSAFPILEHQIQTPSAHG